MNSRNKLFAAAGLLLLLALGVMIWLVASPSSRSPEAAARSRYSVRTSPLSRIGNPPHAKDFSGYMKRVISGDLPKLTHRQTGGFLQANGRNASSLLSAFRLSGDEAFFAEAFAKFPNDPQVIFTALQLSEDSTKRLDLLESFKRADPGNAAGHCLAARALFDLGRNDEAFAELLKSSGKPINDFTAVFTQNDEDALLASGLSPIEAKMSARFFAAKPLLIPLGGEMVKNLNEMRASYASTGDDAAVQSVNDIQWELARKLQAGGTAVDTLVGMLHEKAVLMEIDSDESRLLLEELDQRRKKVLAGSLRIGALMAKGTVMENDWLLYFDRHKLSGEEAANEWVLEKYPEP
jgi:hypothetical protein